MPANADDVIAAIRRSHDGLSSFVGRADGEALRSPSGCSEWNVAQVLSHLGSAAEIGLGTLTAGKADLAAAPAIWDRWNGMDPEGQAAGFVDWSGRLAEAFEALDEEARESRKIDVGFLPAPVDVAFFGGMRLSEMVLHRWDIEVAFNPSAVLAGDAVPLLLGNLPLFSGFFGQSVGRTAHVDVVTSEPEVHYTIELREDGAALAEGAAADAGGRLELPAEALVRLISGRLAPVHTPETVVIEGGVTLDDLRRAWPGY